MDDTFRQPITVQPHRGDSEDVKHTYLPVVPEFLRAGFPLRFDVYHRTASDRLELLYAKGSRLPSDIREQMRREVNGMLYVRGDQKGTLLEHEENVLAELLEDKVVPIEQKCEALQDVTTGLSQELYYHPSAENIRRQRRNVSRLVDFAVKDRSALHGLVRLAHHDYYTYTHSVNVGVYGLAIAMMHFPEKTGEDLHDLTAAFFLHDLGKCRVSPDIINKPGPLDDTEWLEIKKHPSYGFYLLEREKIVSPTTKMVVMQHHERLDGKGYPNGLREDGIHPFARICSIVDAFDALTTNRTYRKAHTPFEALMIMREQLDAQFDSTLYKLFVLQMQNDRQKNGDPKTPAHRAA